MDKQKLNKVLPYIVLALSILSYLMLCRWYIGIIMAVVSLVLGFYYKRDNDYNKMIRAGMILSGVLLLVAAVFLLFMLIYYGVVFLN